MQLSALQGMFDVGVLSPFRSDISYTMNANSLAAISGLGIAMVAMVAVGPNVLVFVDPPIYLSH